MTTPTAGWTPAPILRFSDVEYAARRERATEYADTQGIGALCVTDPINVAYFTGITTPSYNIRSRPVLLVLSVDLANTLICSAGHVSYFSTIWPGAIESYDGLESAAADTLARVAARVPGRQRIGLELGAEQRINLSLGLLTGVQDNWGLDRVVDGSDALNAARRIKSEAEVDAVRHSNLVNHEALAIALAEVSEHRTEIGTYRRWLTETAARGADGPHYLAMHTAPIHVDWINAAPTERRIQAGEILWMDGGPTVGGYWSDITRTVAFDEFSAHGEESYALAREATATLMAAIRPGVTAADVFRTTADFLRSAGQPVNLAGRVGHGIGLQLTESPSLAIFDETPLEVGMVLAVEPVVGGSQRFTVEENVVVTEDGCELLSIPCPEMVPVL